MTKKAKEEELELFRKAAGECVKCENYEYKTACFMNECYSCSRYHSDLFKEREE